MSSNDHNEAQKAVDDLSAHAKMVDAKRLKGPIKVVSRDTIQKLIASIIESHASAWSALRRLPSTAASATSSIRCRRGERMQR